MNHATRNTQHATHNTQHATRNTQHATHNTQHATRNTQHEDIAIIGMAGMFPGAPNLDAFWQNIVSKVDAITDPPPEAWDSDIFYDPDSRENDRVYCKRGGWLGPLAHFNPLEHGIMPKAAEGGEPDQWLALQVARDALADAGYPEGVKEHLQTAVILGKGTYINRGNLTMVQHSLMVDQTLQVLKRLQPELTDEELQLVRQDLKRDLPPFNTETAAAMVPNIVAGRIANRLDLMGPSYTVDAACASSLVAVDTAVRGLGNREYDLALAGGVQVTTPIPILTLFSQLEALSFQEQIRPFDAEADGTILGEGLGMVVLKRREDAERDGDRIYAVIKGVGVASDGRGASVLAPRVEGEELALRRAYEQAGISPRTVGLIEAHGTATLVGDAAEVQALTQVFEPQIADHESQAGKPQIPNPKSQIPNPKSQILPWCALGTVKSMIGHTMPAAGIAGLIKTALALYHKVLPPTLNVDQPSPRLELEKTPFYINTETRPWIHGGSETPRRAGVNAFGFGGINAHVILEEHPLPDETAAQSHHLHWDSEVFILQGESRSDLIRQSESLQQFLQTTSDIALKDLAYTLNVKHENVKREACLAIVASSLQDLQQKLDLAQERLADPACRKIKTRDGVYFFEEPLGREGKLAFLFPGEGAQYVNMLADLCFHFPEVRRCFDEIDRVYAGHTRGYAPSDFIFPRPAFSEEERQAAEDRLWQMDVAIEALLTANHALYTLLECLEIRPDAMLGHSTGEYSAMRAAGMLGDQVLFGQRLLELNRLYEEVTLDGGIPEAELLAVGTDREQAAAIAEEVDGDLYVAMDNCPHQTVLVGGKQAADQALERIRRQGFIYEALPFDRAYHTPLFAPYAEVLREFLASWIVAPPQVPLYSCTTMAPYPAASATLQQPSDRTQHKRQSADNGHGADLTEVRRIAFEHWVQPVEFRKTIEAMYADGVRLFVEVGPRGNLTTFVDDILRGRPYLAVPANVMRRSGITQLNHLLGLLAAHGVAMRLEPLYARRAPHELDLEHPSDPVGEGQRLAGQVKLATGWPPMSVSEETAAYLEGQRDKGTREQGSKGAREQGNRGVGESGSKGDKISNLQSPTSNLQSPTSNLQSPISNLQSPISNLQPATSEVMSAYLQTMEQFLDTQQEVMQAYLTRKEGQGSKGQGAGGRGKGEKGEWKMEGGKWKMEGGKGKGDSNLQSPISNPQSPISNPPFVQELVSLTPGETLEAQCEINLDEYPFLRDHTLGRQVSQIDPELAGLPVMPLTMSMEMLAEAAQVLAPDKVLVGMRDVWAYRWLAVEEGRLALKITARREPSSSEHAIHVQIYEADRSTENRTSQATPVVEGTMLFDDAYPDPPVAPAFSLRNERPSHWEPEQLYAEGMFHGPAFRGVVSMDRWGEDGAEATLGVRPPEKLLASGAAQAFVTDPVLLDQPGQVVAFWMAEHLERGYVIFPFHLEALHLYGAPLPPHARVKCRARITLDGDWQVRSDLDVVRDDGRVWARFVGWEDRRFDVPQAFFRFLLAPRDVVLSEAWPAPMTSLPESESWQAYRLSRDAFPEGFFSAHSGIWQRVLAYQVLSRREREQWRNLRRPELHRLEWLLGRVVAKDAVRRHLERRYGLILCPADIEILPDDNGRPVVRGAWTDQADCVPSLSLSHTAGVAVAVAGGCDPEAGVGVDIEPVDRMNDNIEGLAFTPKEQALLSAVRDGEQAEWPLRLWCAKEAVAKALGQGMLGGPQSLVVQTLDISSGMVQISLSGELARRVREGDGVMLTAFTARDEDWVMATSLIVNCDQKPGFWS